MINAKSFLLLCSIAFVSGCANVQAPKDIGVGKFAQLVTTSGSPIFQMRFQSPIGCEMEVRTSWSASVGNNTSMKCSDDDMSGALPYLVKIEGPSNAMAPTDVRFANLEFCEAGFKLLNEKHPGAKYINECSQ